MTVFGDRVFMEITVLNEVMRWSPNPGGPVSSEEEEKIPEERPCEDTRRRWLSACQGGGLRKNQPCQHLNLEPLAFGTRRK